VLRHLYEVWTADLSSIARDAAVICLLLVFLYTFRRWRQADLVRRPGPIDVAQLINATGKEDLNLVELATEFRTTLGRVDLNSPAAVPGATRPVEFLELLRSVTTEKSIVATIAGLLGVTWVTHSYSVTAVLRLGDDPVQPYGITTTVTIIPRGGTPPYTVWASSWREAVEKAALAVGASILPLTRLCRRPPWSDWQGLELPPALFATYMQAKSLASQRRYDEALGQFHKALELDPLNLHLRLEIGALQEQLQLFLDALETYDDVIALGSRYDERLTHAWFDRLLYLSDLARAGHKVAVARAEERATRPLGDGWRGPRAKRGIRPPPRPWRNSDLHRALLLARYRYAVILGFSEVLIAQWVYGGEDEPNERERERERLRQRLLPRLAHYPFRDHTRRVVPAIASIGPRDALTRIMPERQTSLAEGDHLEDIERRLRSLVRQAKKLADLPPACREHENFSKRFKNAHDLLDDGRAGSAQTLRLAAKSIRAAALVCDEKDWTALVDAADLVLTQLRPAARPKVTEFDLLRAQALLQGASLSEIQQLKADYRWFRGRRRHDHPISPTSIRVSEVLAELRERRVLARINLHAAAGQAIEAAEPEWPPKIGWISRRVGRAIGKNPWAGHDWQDFYNAACVFATILLPDNNWGGLHFGSHVIQPNDLDAMKEDETRNHEAAQHVVRALERAMDSSDSNFAAGQRSWLAYEDPDFAGFRTRREFAHFRGRNIAAAEAPPPLPKNVNVLQVGAYVTGILKAMTTLQIASWSTNIPSEPTTSQLKAWFERDKECWQWFTELALDFRDWRSRLRAIRRIGQLANADGIAAPVLVFPAFPDPTIGNVWDLSAPYDSRSMNIGGKYARQERDGQLARLREIIRFGQNAPGGPGRKPGPLVRGELLETRPLNSAAAMRRILVKRVEAWEKVSEALSLVFFTDDKDELRDRKSKALALEDDLRTLVAALTLSVAPEDGPGSVS